MLLTECIDKLDDTLQRLSRHAYLRTLLCLLIFTIAYNGLSFEPSHIYRLFAENPFKATYIWGTNFFQESPLLPLVAYYSHLTSRLSFLLLSFSISLAGLIVLATILRKQLPKEVSLLIMFLLAGHPAILHMLSSPGTPDGITLLVAVFALFSRSYAAFIIIGVIGGFNHPITLFVMPTLIILRKLSRDTTLSWYHLPTAIGALALGNFCVYLYLRMNEIIIISRFAAIKKLTLTEWLHVNIQHLPHTLFSFHNMIWAALTVCVILVFSQNKRYFIALFLSQILFYGIAFFTIDTTRVFALLAWAPAFHCIIYSLQVSRQSGDKKIHEQLRKALWVVALTGLVLPKYFFLGGVFGGYRFTDFYVQLLKYLQALL